MRIHFQVLMTYSNKDFMMDIDENILHRENSSSAFKQDHYYGILKKSDINFFIKNKLSQFKMDQTNDILNNAINKENVLIVDCRNSGKQKLCCIMLNLRYLAITEFPLPIRQDCISYSVYDIQQINHYFQMSQQRMEI